MKTFAKDLTEFSITFFSLFSPFIGEAQEQVPINGPTSSISLELDPTPFLLNGYSFSLRYSPKSHSNWSIMTSCFAADFPDRMLTDENTANGWSDLQFRSSNALFIDYSLRSDGRGFFFGPSVFVYNNKVSHEPSDHEYSFRSIYPNMRLGYTWFPFKQNGFYVSPWLNLGSEMVLGDASFKDAPKYVPSSFKYIVAVHLGYRLSWDGSAERCKRAEPGT